jgi:uncharacterized membrane protein YkvA (DUF1232 family)
LTGRRGARTLRATMRITFELEAADIERFQAALARSRRQTRCADEVDVIDATKYALDHLAASAAPAYVRKRLVEVQRLILMLEDEAWALSDPERSEVIETLAYFSDPDDLIPDDIEVIGLLDDAIMLEILLRKLRVVLNAYADFCAYRTTLAAMPGDAETRRQHARCLAERRAKLQARMRRRRARTAKVDAETQPTP